jgi:hypothetical protein
MLTIRIDFPMEFITSFFYRVKTFLCHRSVFIFNFCSHTGAYYTYISAMNLLTLEGNK